MDLLAADRDVRAATEDVRRFGRHVDWELHRPVSGQRGLAEIAATSKSPLRTGLIAAVSALTVTPRQPSGGPKARSRRKRSPRDRSSRTRSRDRLSSNPSRSRRRQKRRSGSGLFRRPSAVQPNLREPSRTLAEIRTEAFHRLGIDDVSQHFLGVKSSVLVSSARRFLVLTEDLAAEARGRKIEADRVWPIDLEARLAKSAVEGWPARLTFRSAAALLPGLALRGIDLDRASAGARCRQLRPRPSNDWRRLSADDDGIIGGLRSS